MGTWDTGPFDNDTAADFAGDLDDAEPGEREALIRGVLTRTVDATDHLWEAEEAVAAAALIAAQCPGGEPVDDIPYGPRTPVPALPADLRALADEALARIAGDENGPAADWVDAEDGKQWRVFELDGGTAATGGLNCHAVCGGWCWVPRMQGARETS
ncbi:DUF4259 domain-containing protein [Streptomyces spiralis]|nr:DUF4259 domain-containing protein [Streptomyces spiralis]